MARKKKIHKLVIATTSEGKIEQIKYFFGVRGFEVVSLTDIKKSYLPDPEETGTTYYDNAAEKAVYYSKLLGCAVIADDSGIELDALDGAPGIYTKRYPSMNGSELSPTDYLLKRMEGKEDRSASYHSCIALAVDGKVMFVGTGEVAGKISIAKKRGYGAVIGVERIFIPSRCKKVLAEMHLNDKILRCPRGIAATHVVKFLKEYNGEEVR